MLKYFRGKKCRKMALRFKIYIIYKTMCVITLISNIIIAIFETEHLIKLFDNIYFSKLKNCLLKPRFVTAIFLWQAIVRGGLFL
jgi:hypothetical protein